MARLTRRIDFARGAVHGFFAEGIGEAGGRDRLVMARALGSLFFAGALIGLASLALPRPEGTNVVGLVIVCAIALFVGVGLAFDHGRLPNWAFPAACYGATLLIA